MKRTGDVYRPTQARVDLEAILANYRLLQEHAGGAQVCPVVKADAYGHGVGPVCRALAGDGCDTFAVSSLEEALELREEGIDETVLLLFGAPSENVGLLAREGFVPVIGTLAELGATARGCAAENVTLAAHIHFDTGMGREGIPVDGLDRVAGLLAAPSGGAGLRLEGVATHFACAGESEAFTGLQQQRFEMLLAGLRQRGIDPGRIHASNSAACLTRPTAAYDMVRTGIALYGCAPEPGLDGGGRLRPALSWITAVGWVREVAPETPLGYGRAFVTCRPSRIAALPVGYADGYSRRLGGRGQVLVRGQAAPVIGRVCMDIILVDVTDVDGVGEGDEVVLLGAQGERRIRVEQMAGWLDTISYEVLCNISRRVPRVYPGDNGAGGAPA